MSRKKEITISRDAFVGAISYVHMFMEEHKFVSDGLNTGFKLLDQILFDEENEEMLENLEKITNKCGKGVID